MNFKLVVKHPFKDYGIGDEITDADEIEAAKASHPSHVLQVDADAPPAEWVSHEPPALAVKFPPPKPPEAPAPPPPPPGDKS